MKFIFTIQTCVIFLFFGCASWAVEFESTYENIQWGKRNDDTFYCIDICDANWNVYENLRGLGCGENFYSWSPKAFVASLGLNDLPEGTRFNWRVWSPSGYGGSGFEGQVVVGKKDIYIFTKLRTEYSLDLIGEGTSVLHHATGERTIVPFGSEMHFSNGIRYSKNTSAIIHNIRSHAETYTSWNDIVDLPVDFLRTAMNHTWEGKSPQESIDSINTCPYAFPDKPDRVAVAYINLMSFSITGVNWDFACDSSWDSDNDYLIDDNVTDLPDYVDKNVFDEEWKGYVVAYWTESWKNILKKKVDLVATENFDGVMFDLTTGYWSWMRAYPDSNLDDLRQKSVTVIKEISDYAKSKYGNAFLITANLDSNVNLYFEDLGYYIDGGYFQNAFFNWDGSGIINDYGFSNLAQNNIKSLIDFVKGQNISLLNMDHLGTGPVTPGLDFENYNDQITEEKLLLIFRWAAESNFLPYITTVFMSEKPYGKIPRFSRIIPDKAAFENTEYNDWVIGSNADDVVVTGVGADLFYGGEGNDYYEGGPDNDTVLFKGNMNNYTILQDKNTVTVIDNIGQEGIDTLVDIERLIFNDTIYEILF